MPRLEGKVAIITGAGTGVGRSCLKIFAREGAKVVGAGRTQATLDEIDRAIGRLGEGTCSMCNGMGCSMCGTGPGPGGEGNGFGPRPFDDSGKTGTKRVRTANKPGQGPVIASWYFKESQIKGEATRDFTEVVQAARDGAAEAISENEIPRRYEDAIKSYFGRLEQSGGE